MLKINFGAATALILVCLMAFSAFALDGETTKVQFAKGKSSAVYTGKISKTDGVHHYDFHAKAGQKVTISVSSTGKMLNFYFSSQALPVSSMITRKPGAGN